MKIYGFLKITESPSLLMRKQAMPVGIKSQSAYRGGADEDHKTINWLEKSAAGQWMTSPGGS
jgi:hypothetical protein